MFTLLLGADAFSHLCQLASGQVLSPESLLPWISDADMTAQWNGRLACGFHNRLRHRRGPPRRE